MPERQLCSVVTTSCEECGKLLSCSVRKMDPEELDVVDKRCDRGFAPKSCPDHPWALRIWNVRTNLPLLNYAGEHVPV